MTNKRVSTAATLVLTASVAGCGTLPSPSGCVSTPEAGNALVTLAGESGPAERRVRFTDPREFDEYVLYRGHEGGRLEAVYMETRWKHGDNVVLQFFEPLPERVLGFAYNRGTDPAFGDGVRIDTAFGGMWAMPYRHPVTGQSCAGFMETWDERSSDPQFRPQKAIYGYYCAPPGAQQVGAAAPEGVLSRLEAGLQEVAAGTGTPDCAGAGARTARPQGQALLDRAQASGGAGELAAAGDANFPPVRAVRFQESDGTDDWD